MFGKYFKKKAIKKENIFAPLTGSLLPISEVPDPVFSKKMMGEGVAITPNTQSQTILSPVDGEIIQLAETKHAFGIHSKLGQEILVHIGLDTVELNGSGFKEIARVGDHVKAGDPVIFVDFDYIKEHKKETIVPIVVTNTAEDKFSFEWAVPDKVIAGQSILFVAKLK